MPIYWLALTTSTFCNRVTLNSRSFLRLGTSRPSSCTAGNAVCVLLLLFRVALKLALAIQSVTVASHHAEFVHYDPLANISVSNPQDCHTYPELKRKLYSALAEGDEGELSIAIPKEVSLKQSGHAAAGTIHSEGSDISRVRETVSRR